MNVFENIKLQKQNGHFVGIYSCCSSNPFVIEAAISRALLTDTDLLVEATANQVNQFGGYTGMTPWDFQQYIMEIARTLNFPEERLLLGGDHLGPLIWKHLPESDAMENARVLVEDYISAGFTKIHLDTSMHLASDDISKSLPVGVIAARAAQLCLTAEITFQQRRQSHPGTSFPIYVIGSEVPIPGGAQEEQDELEITRPEDCISTIESFRTAFLTLNLENTWERVVGVVVQPGVEFGDTDVFHYNSSAANNLCKVLNDYPSLVFEGHSTDYQTKEDLQKMVQDGIAILKVGPALTFALRQGLFALECIEAELYSETAKRSNFRKTLDAVMVENPIYWINYYQGCEEVLGFKRAFSQSDRCRYYLTDSRIQCSIQHLLDNLSIVDIPFTLLNQFLPYQYNKVREGKLLKEPKALLLDVIGTTIDDYLYAVK